MADNSKRKRTDLSSTSSLDTSHETSFDPTSETVEKDSKLTKSQRRKKAKNDSKEMELNLTINPPTNKNTKSETMENATNSTDNSESKTIENTDTTKPEKEAIKTTEQEGIKSFFTTTTSKDKAKTTKENVTKSTENTGSKTHKITDKKTKPEKETMKPTEKEGIKSIFTNQTNKGNTKTTKTTKTTETNLEKCLTEINLKLNNVLTKDDDAFLKNIIKVTILEMREEILASVTHRIEKMEGDFHDLALENEILKQEIKDLKQTVNDKNDKTEQTKISMEKQIEQEKGRVDEKLNEHEQYSRRNNVRIFNLPEDRKDEHSVETTYKVIGLLNTSLKLNLTPQAIDIAHRLGPYQPGRNRRVIVKFVHRQVKFMILSKAKWLKGSGIQIFEDLTQLNNKILACTRKKLPDEIEDSWYSNGIIYIKWKTNGVVE